MHEVFNLGIGLVSVINKKDVDRVLEISKPEFTRKVIGKVGIIIISSLFISN